MLIYLLMRRVCLLPQLPLITALPAPPLLPQQLQHPLQISSPSATYTFKPQWQCPKTKWSIRQTQFVQDQSTSRGPRFGTGGCRIREDWTFANWTREAYCTFSQGSFSRAKLFGLSDGCPNESWDRRSIARYAFAGHILFCTCAMAYVLCFFRG